MRRGDGDRDRDGDRDGVSPAPAASRQPPASRDLTCRELLEFLSDYLDGALPPERQAEFERHLAVCPACVSYIQSYRETIRLAKGAYGADGDAPARAPEELIRAILAARGK